MFDLKISRQMGQTALAAAISLCAVANTSTAFATTVADPVVLTFSTVGDSRQDSQNVDSSVLAYAAATTDVNKSQLCALPSGSTGTTANPGLSGQDCKWLQNTAASTRILRTIQSQKASLLFFNGDMISGYGKAGAPVTRNSTGTNEAPITTNLTLDNVLNSDVMQIYKQYGFWRGMVANLLETGTYIVPVPGNHETECKRCTDPNVGNGKVKLAQVENENAWRDNMGDLIIDQTRLNRLLSPLALTVKNVDISDHKAADSLTTAQNQMSYSFDVGTSHFAVINTDPVGKDGYAPTEWLNTDLSTALTNGAKQLFVFGHKPAYFYLYNTSAPSITSSLTDRDSAAGAAFWAVINQHNATYFAGHEHIYNLSQPSGANTAYQVIVGAGGSPFEDSAAKGTAATDRLYSWATVSILKSGKAVLNTYGFDATITNPVVKLDSVTLPALQ